MEYMKNVMLFGIMIQLVFIVLALIRIADAIKAY